VVGRVLLRAVVVARDVERREERVGMLVDARVGARDGAVGRVARADLVRVRARVRVGVRVRVRIGARVRVRVRVGVKVGVGVRVGIGVRVGVGVRVEVRVRLGLG